MSATATAAPRKTKSSKTNQRHVKSLHLDEDDKELIRSAVMAKNPHWDPLRINGATDAEIATMLNFFLNRHVPFEAATENHRAFCVQREPQAIWFGQADRSGTPDLEGAALTAAVRDALGIGQPQHLVAHHDNGKVRHTREPKAATPAVIGDAASPATGNTGIVILETIDVPLSKIRRSPFQTRSEPDKAWLQEVAESLRMNGQSTPALGRWIDDAFELVAGHTRWAAAESIEWTTLRCEVCDIDDATAARLVYLENAKRRELSPIDRAKGLKLIADQYAASGKSQAQCAADVGISESQLSNMLRLLRLPPAWQSRSIAGELSIEQSRALVTWVDYPKVIEAFSKHIENCGLSEGLIDKHHFESAIAKGIDSGSRPMGKDAYGGGCLFKPTEAERKELDIRKVSRSYGGDQERAFNVTLWNKLQKTAKEKKKEREKAAADKSGSAKGVGPAKRARAQYQFDEGIHDAWLLAERAALAQRLSEKKKLSSAERAVVARLVLYFDDRLAEEIPPHELMPLSAADCEDRLVAIVKADVISKLNGPWDTGSFDFEPLHAVAVALGLDGTSHFRVTTETFRGFGDDDLVALAAEMDIELAGKREDRIAQIVAEPWPREDVPALLQLPTPKKPKAKK